MTAHIQRSQEVLASIASTFALLSRDLTLFNEILQSETARFKRGQIHLEAICFWQKSAIGALFGLITGLCHSMAAQCGDAAAELGVSLSRKELALLQELDRLKPLPLLKFSLRLVGKVFNDTFTVDTSTDDFRAVSALLNARNDFSHPASASKVCPFEIFPTYSPAAEWFLRNIHSMLTSCREIAFGVRPSAAPRQRFSYRDADLVPFSTIDRELPDETDFVANLQYVLKALFDQTDRAFELISKHSERSPPLPLDCAVRNFYRFLFAEIEGATILAGRSLDRFGFVRFDARHTLNGKSPDVRERIAVLVERFSAAFGTGKQFDRASTEWSQFPGVRDIRNRINHPGTLSDLYINSNELDPLLDLYFWWRNVLLICVRLDPHKLVPLLT